MATTSVLAMLLSGAGAGQGPLQKMPIWLGANSRCHPPVSFQSGSSMASHAGQHGHDGSISNREVRLTHPTSWATYGNLHGRVSLEANFFTGLFPASWKNENRCP